MIASLKSNAQIEGLPACNELIVACDEVIKQADRVIAEKNNVINTQDSFIKEQDEMLNKLTTHIEHNSVWYRKPETNLLFGLTVGLFAGILASK